MKILLLEDDYLYRQSVKEYLENLGYEVDEATDGKEACDKISKNFYHLLIIDIKVPEISGYDVIKYAKDLNLKTPIMIMTSLVDIDNISIGYELGCNEYLKKPFNLAELKFRVNELMRKYYMLDDKSVVKIADKFHYDFIHKNLKFKDIEIALSQREIELIEFLLLNIGSFVSPETIRDEIWKSSDIEGANIRVYVGRIRAKTSEDFIISSRGLGYKINV